MVSPVHRAGALPVAPTDGQAAVPPVSEIGAADTAQPIAADWISLKGGQLEVVVRDEASLPKDAYQLNWRGSFFPGRAGAAEVDLFVSREEPSEFRRMADRTLRFDLEPLRDAYWDRYGASTGRMTLNVWDARKQPVQYVMEGPEAPQTTSDPAPPPLDERWKSGEYVLEHRTPLSAVENILASGTLQPTPYNFGSGDFRPVVFAQAVRRDLLERIFTASDSAVLVFSPELVQSSNFHVTRGWDYGKRGPQTIGPEQVSEALEQLGTEQNEFVIDGGIDLASQLSRVLVLPEHRDALLEKLRAAGVASPVPGVSLDALIQPLPAFVAETK